MGQALAGDNEYFLGIQIGHVAIMLRKIEFGSKPNEDLWSNYSIGILFARHCVLVFLEDAK
jgi:hypothetical protein